MSTVVPVKLYLTEPQESFVFSKAPHPGMVAGYGAGKSEAAVIRIALKALQYPGMSFGFVEPTFDLVRLIAWPRFQAKLDEWGIGYELNKAEAILRLENGSQVIFRSADNPERMVGFEIADGLIDEADTLRPDQAQTVWIKMLGRIRQKKHDGSINTLGAVSTPEGYGWMYQTWGKEIRPGYELIRAPTSSNPYLPDGYIDQLKATYGTQHLLAYLEGKWTNLTAGSVYPEFDRHENASSEEIRSNEPVLVGTDFNTGNCSAVVAVLRNNTIHFVAEHLGLRDTPTMADFLKQKYRGHHVTIFPDASGAATKSTNAALSDIVILRSAGFTVLANSRNPAIRDRVASMNAMIHNQGRRRLFVRPDTCPLLIEALERQSFDKNGDPCKASGFDHCTDAAGYLITYKFPIHLGPVSFARVVGA